jgi:predicted RNA-binding Zn-ribbon protein involved in translation (DUF1610 family)
MNLLRDIRGVLKATRRRRPTRIYCPKCGSTKIRLSTAFNYWLTPRKYTCDDCGYNGSIIMELEKENSDSQINPEALNQAASSTSYNDSSP